MNTPIICIYHKDCVDGTTAAAVVLRKFPEVQCFPLSHSYTKEDFAPIEHALRADADLYIVDSILGIHEALTHECRITIIDHHISAREEAEQIAKDHSQVTFIFDNEKSGASLTWSYLFPEDPLPEMIRYVEDSDLWKGMYGPTTKHVAHYLSIYRNNPTRIRELLDTPTTFITERGAIISEYTDAAEQRLIEIPPITLKINHHEVLAFNITDHESACGNLLSQKHAQAVAMYTIRGSHVKLSFRSQENQEPSALDLAITLGGGGHRNASGATVPLSIFLERILWKI